jgi:anoctamin-8
MEMMGIVGVTVNCALIGLSGQVNRLIPDMTPTQTILLIIVLEVLTWKTHDSKAIF